ncbi:MAG TPA: hypothetical protein VN803_01480, partial [Gemmatimonadales bacterium]|nr:hypothetical protein [Gemmatimonadales bacterium]
MSPLAVQIGAGLLAVLALFALRGKRWAYFGVVLLGLAYFPAQAQFHVHVPKCEQVLPTVQQLVPLLHNYAYIALFAGFYWISWVQFRDADARTIWALLATLLAAVLVEVAEGMTGGGRGQAHCRVRDLVPDAAGALGASVLLAIWARLRRKPAYVRLGKPRSAAPPAPRPVAPSPRGGLPPRAVVYDPPAYAPPPAPPDFSPGPTTEVTPAAHAAPAEEIAPNRATAARAALVQRLRAVLGRVRPGLRRIWAIIWGRRRAIVVGLVLVVLVGAGVFAFLRLSAPTPVVTAQPEVAAPEPPPPPPRPLQAEVEGYYEPSYKFSVFDRRFTRLTLRPNTSVTFSRVGSRQEVPCEEARIG